MKKPILALLALCLCPACTTIEETITSPDGTVTTRKSSSVDAAAFTAGANAVTAIAAPRGRIVAEK